uniref:SAP domain-containing protein n=1 Tax=Timema monikensis TaxID=170555 RepID=A0A7R9HUV0_9NEOP|nr:unnamed protein product [Timema monikensis]
MADISGESEHQDITKMKVADLKRELKVRNLNTSGNKTELIERLQLAIQGVETDQDVVLGETESVAEEILDEDDVLGDEEALEEDDIGDISKTDDSIEEPTTPTLKRKLSTDSGKPQAGKKIVLNRSVISTSPEKENVISEPAAEEAVEAENKQEEDGKKKVVKISALTVKERLEMRAQKFGVSLSVDAKKEARAARFGIQSSSISSTNGSTSVDTLKKRAERFGTSVSSVLTKVDDEEKLKKRQQRFGLVEPPNKTSTTPSSVSTVSASDDKKKLRAERFKLNK